MRGLLPHMTRLCEKMRTRVGFVDKWSWDLNHQSSFCFSSLIFFLYVPTSISWTAETTVGFSDWYQTCTFTVSWTYKEIMQPQPAIKLALNTGACPLPLFTVARLCLACISNPCPSTVMSATGRKKLGEDNMSIRRGNYKLTNCDYEALWRWFFIYAFPRICTDFAEDILLQVKLPVNTYVNSQKHTSLLLPHTKGHRALRFQIESETTKMYHSPYFYYFKIIGQGSFIDWSLIVEINAKGFLCEMTACFLDI